MDELTFRKAQQEDSNKIWTILQQAIERRKLDGSTQWQDGYPNPDTIDNDISKNIGYVLVDKVHGVIAYAAILKNDEPAYADIEGQWLTNEDFLVVHRVAVSDEVVGRGIAQEIFRKIEDLALSMSVFSIKVDTNFDNLAMLRILDKLEYTYCGEVFFRGASRKAFEKVLKK
mgnify:FL=1